MLPKFCLHFTPSYKTKSDQAIKFENADFPDILSMKSYLKVGKSQHIADKVESDYQRMMYSVRKIPE